MKPAPFAYYRPDTVEETLSLLAEHGDDAKLLAGGQSLVPMMNFRLAQPRSLIDLAGVGALEGIQQNGTLEVGSMTRQSVVLDSAAIAERAPLLADVMPWIGHSANRNRGTFGGSVAHADPAAELPAALLALDAEMVIRGPGGERVVSADDFFLFYLTTALAADELLTAVRIPDAPEPARRVASFLEVARRRGDFALVGVCLVADLDAKGVVRDARCALLGVGERPLRIAEADALLTGQRLQEPGVGRAVAQRVSEGLDPSADHHASSQYRKEVAGTLVERAIENAAQRAEERTR